jgi:WD40 repeat protein
VGFDQNDRLITLKGHSGTVYSLAVMTQPSGSEILFSASYDKSIKIWDLESCACRQTMERQVTTLFRAWVWVLLGIPVCHFGNRASQRAAVPDLTLRGKRLWKRTLFEAEI